MAWEFEFKELNTRVFATVQANKALEVAAIEGAGALSYRTSFESSVRTGVTWYRDLDRHSSGLGQNIQEVTGETHRSVGFMQVGNLSWAFGLGVKYPITHMPLDDFYALEYGGITEEGVPLFGRWTVTRTGESAVVRSNMLRSINEVLNAD